jgi:hypothetical protein
LIDLDRQMPRTGQLHGYDISSAYFPPADELPNNIRFNILDATQSPPAHLIEQYDVVHLGHVGLYIRNEDPSDFLRTGISMLSTWCSSRNIVSVTNLARARWVCLLGRIRLGIDSAYTLRPFGLAWSCRPLGVIWLSLAQLSWRYYEVSVLLFREVRNS